MDHSEFFGLIKSGGLSGAYLLHGEEEYVKDSALNGVLSTVDDAARELNIQSAETADDIRTACETLPFFADRRVVIAHCVPTGDEGAKLKDYLASVPDTAILIFFLRAKADSTTAIYKTLAKAGRVVLFDPLERNQAVKWALQQCKGHGVTMAQQTAELIVDFVGTDLSKLNNELSKAAAYAGEGNEITRDHIKAAVTRNLEYRIFDMADYFLAGKTGDGLKALDVLIKDGETPVGIAAFLSSRFKQMLSARECMDSGLDRAAAVKRMGGSPYYAGKVYDSARRYSRRQLIRYISALSELMDKKISGGAKEAEVLQTALISCSIKG